MAGFIFEGVPEIENEDEVRLFAFRLRNGNRRSVLEKLLTDGIEIISGAALATCTLKSNFHPMWPLCFSVMTAEGVVYFCKHLLKLYRKLHYLQKEHLKYTSLLSIGTVIYFSHVAAFNESLKQNDNTWITHLGIAAVGYYISLSANIGLGRLYHYEEIFLEIHPAYKYFHLLFEPTLIASAAYYLLVVQIHDEKWLPIFFLIFSVPTTLNISFDAAMRVQFNGMSLINGMELFLGGSILCINIAVIIIYAVNNQLSPIVIAVFIYLFYIGAREINASLQYLHNRVPRPLFKRYCQRVLGPMLTVYSSLASAYTFNRMGWRISLAFVPFIAAGIYTTYRGWK